LIDARTGELRLGPIVIAPRADEAAFLATPFGRTLPPAAGPFTSYSVRVDDPAEGSFFATLYFRDGVIAMVGFYKDDGSRSWADWSEDKERALQAEYAALLARELGPAPHTFPWGSAEALYDPRSASSSIVVTYAR